MEHFTTSYQLLDDGGVRFVAATLDGQTFTMVLSAEDALTNLRAFAHTLGLVVALPLP